VVWDPQKIKKYEFNIIFIEKLFSKGQMTNLQMTHTFHKGEMVCFLLTWLNEWNAGEWLTVETRSLKSVHFL
jgi:hypothetical protein